jgi:3-isopropylmalate/(R)-2-methylmalate dehydratase large subunit
LPGATIIDKIWDSHVVKQFSSGEGLLHIDRHCVLDLGSNVCFDRLRRANRTVRNPELTFAIQDHTLATDIDRDDATFPPGRTLIEQLRANARAARIRLYDVQDPEQGIVHVVAPEQAIVLPGCTFVAGDSHSSTTGGVGCLGFGIGASEVEHVLATQTLRTRKPKRMRVCFEGALQPGVAAKDLILYLIGQIGADGGTGHAVEYGGAAIRSLPIDSRLTICNMSIEFGARVGLIAPDDDTFEYLHGRRYAPKGKLWDRAVDYWRALRSDADCVFDREVTVNATSVVPHVTWGTSPMDVIPISAVVPDPSTANSVHRRTAMERACDYMGIQPGRPLEGLKVDWAFIGSCTNSRLADLQAAAAVLRGRKVAPGVRGIIVPGSMKVRSEAEALGLDRIFREAGFEWRASACSLCAGANADVVGRGERCISSSNRNFEGRQGAGARTHLASPQMVAAAAVAGCITDVRNLMSQECSPSPS